jgi:hypothetical protein
MLDSISFQSTPSTAQMACLLGAGAFLGRKIIIGGGCKALASVSDFLGKENASEWNEAGDNYLKLARKDFFRDCAGAVAIGGLGYLAAGALTGEVVPEPVGLTQKILGLSKSALGTAGKIAYFIGKYSTALTVGMILANTAHDCVSGRFPGYDKSAMTALFASAVASGGVILALSDPYKLIEDPLQALQYGFVGSIIPNIGIAAIVYGLKTQFLDIAT